MAFYNRIVEAYDQLFPFNPKQLDFVEKGVGVDLSNKRILDIGCGTGSLAINLARRSANVDAFDFDPMMIAKAEEKRPQALNLRFRQGDMMQSNSMYQKASFDAILCFGNTLVHLVDRKQIENVLGSIADGLKENGRFFMQIVNYDRILINQVDHLPTIDTVDYSFTRDYIHREDGLIDFSTRLTAKKNKEELQNSIPLLPLRKSELLTMLNGLFAEVHCFGGFDRSEWTEQSFHLVIEAVK